MKDNPFKMWGSWIGAVVALAIPIKLCYFLGCSTVFGFQFLLLSIPSMIKLEKGSLMAFGSGFSIALIGFTVGWVITILIRKMRGKIKWLKQ